MDFRIYTWKEDYASVVRRIDIELLPSGFKRHEGVFTSWLGPKGESVMAEPGRSESKAEAVNGKMVNDPRWVTVFCGNEAPENWMTHVRIALEPSY
jgi:hypothetical protein